MIEAVIHCVPWLAAPAVAIAGLRRRSVGDYSGVLSNVHGLEARASQGQREASRRGAAAAAVAISVLLLVALLAATTLTGPGSGSWGSRWSLRRRACKPPVAQQRLAAWGSLAGFNYSILTESDEAQAMFNQGLLLAFDFNRAESLASFQACAAADPGATLCHWGAAYALGPYLNAVAGTEEEGRLFPVFGPAAFRQAHVAAQRAVELAQQAVQRKPDSKLAQQELSLCIAMAARFADGAQMGPERDAAEREFAAAMLVLGEAEEDATALALAAEAYLNLCPWDFVDPSSHTLRDDARAAEALLLRALRLRPRHELALHLHVHLAEVGAPAPGGASLSRAGLSQGEQSADTLAGLQPRMAHLLHMPSHLYIRLGRYHDAVQVNIQAYGADVAGAQECLQSYIPEHNLQMLMFAASMAGQYSVLEEWAAKLWTLPEVMPRSAWPGRERTMLLLAQVRFGLWDKVMDTPPPAAYERGPGDPGGHEFAVAVWHYARCLALASKAQHAQHEQHAAAARRHRRAAEAEAELLRGAVARLPPDVQTRPGQGVGIYSPDNRDLGAMAVKVAEARLLALDARWHDAVAALAAAADLELSPAGAGAYVEPPRLLHQPLLECLGWVHLHMGRHEEAAWAYRRNLAAHPGDGWALFGLSQALMQGGHSAEAAEVLDRFRSAWAHADVQLASSCPAFAT